MTRPKSARFGQRRVAEDEDPSVKEPIARPASRRSRPKSARHGRSLTVRDPADDTGTDGETPTPRTRPKSAKYGYRIPQCTDSDLEDSACEQDIETLNLEDSDNDCRGSDGSDSSNSDAPIEAWDIGLHGDVFNNEKNTMHYPSNATNKEDNISSDWDSAILDVGEDPDGDTLSDKSTESGQTPSAVLRIKRKHLRRRVVSTSDIETDQRSRKCNLLVSSDHDNNAAILHSEIDSSFIAEKLVERYRRRAASDASPQSRREGWQLDRTDARSLNNSQTNKRAMPPMPRKLRPIFRRSGNLLGEGSGAKSNGSKRGEGEWPAENADNCPLVTVVPPSFKSKKPLDECMDVIPTSPQNVQKNKSKRRLKPIEPLTVSLGDGGATYESDSPPDSACIMEKCSGFALPHRRLSDSLSRSPITPRSPNQLSSRENSFVFDDQVNFKSNKTMLQPIRTAHKLFGSGEILPDKEPAVKKPTIRTRSLPMEPMRITCEKSMTEF